MAVIQPTISIGLPVYNGAVYLRQALDSLLAQTYSNLELIIGDNASSDETESICREYVSRDARVNYYRHAENLGAMENFLFVFKQAKGKFFMWAAHDDLWDRDWIERLYEVVSTETAVMAYGQVRTIDDTGRPMRHPANGRSFRFNQENGLLRRLTYFLEYEGLGKANPIYGLYRRRDVVKGLAAFQTGSLFSDCLFLFDMLSGVKLKSVRNTFHYKRVLSGTTLMAGGPYRSIRKIRNLLRGLFLPEATVGYILRATRGERLLMMIAIPTKVLFSCYGLLVSRVLARWRGRRGLW